MSMDESEAVSFFDEMVNDTPSTARETYVLESETGHELTVYIKQLDRAYVIDKLAELPDEMLQQMEDVDDPENMDEEDAIEATNGLGGLSGDAIRAFEELCAEGMDHSDLTTHQFERIVGELSLEVLFEIGSIIIELSLEEDGRITGFRKAE